MRFATETSQVVCQEVWYEHAWRRLDRILGERHRNRDDFGSDKPFVSALPSGGCLHNAQVWRTGLGLAMQQTAGI